MSKKILLAIIYFILSLTVTLQLRTTKDINNQQVSIEYKMSQITNQLENEKNLTDNLTDEINKNLKEKERYINIFADDKEKNDLKNQWIDANLRAGLTDVDGKGVVITLMDAPVKNNTYNIIDGSQNNRIEAKNFIVHDMDIVNVLNELKVYGAQAISMNGERIISVSEQICAGPTIRVNKRRYAPPFEIKAIGDQDNLFYGLSNSEYINFLSKYNIRIDIKKDNKILIPKYKNDIKNLVAGLEVVE